MAPGRHSRSYQQGFTLEGSTRKRACTALAPQRSRPKAGIRLCRPIDAVAGFVDSQDLKLNLHIAQVAPRGRSPAGAVGFRERSAGLQIGSTPLFFVLVVEGDLGGRALARRSLGRCDLRILVGTAQSLSTSLEITFHTLGWSTDFTALPCPGGMWKRREERNSEVQGAIPRAPIPNR